MRLSSKQIEKIQKIKSDTTPIVLKSAKEIKALEIALTLGELGETRSRETGNHVKRVALYSKELALLHRFSQKDAEKLQMASPMHDIGKVGIPDAILNAPRKLTQEEFKVMKTHAALGYEMLKHFNKEIHIYGRITAIADVFDALGSERVYKKAWELEKILELFKEQSGKHFDPTLIQLFLENLDIFLEIRSQFTDIPE